MNLIFYYMIVYTLQIPLIATVFPYTILFRSLNITQLLSAFVNFRGEVSHRRTRYLLGKARDRAHVLVGLAIAVANIDEVIRTIRAAPDPQTAREQLMGREWPAADVADMILLIDDLSHKVVDGTYRLSETQRSEERRVGKGRVSTCRYRWSP